MTSDFSQRLAYNQGDYAGCEVIASIQNELFKRKMRFCTINGYFIIGNGVRASGLSFHTKPTKL